MPTVTITRNYAVVFYNTNYPVPEPPATEEDYLALRNAAECSDVYENGAKTGAYQRIAGDNEGFYMGRTALYFDTSSLEGVNINSVILRVYVFSGMGIYCGCTVQNGQPTYPHNPGVAGDFSLSHYSGNGGQIPTGLSAGWYDIELTEDGISWINKTGETKLILRNDNDINGIPCTHGIGEGYTFDNSPTYYSPKLIITYDEVTVTTEDPAQVGVDHAKGNGTATGSPITKRGFEVRLAFSGSLSEAINRSIAGFEGDLSWDLVNKWNGTLVKTITETGSFAAGAFIDDLGRFPIAVVTDKLFAAETYEYRAYADIDGVTYYGDYVEFTMAGYPAGEGPDDVISPEVPIIGPLPDEEEEELPEWEWPDIVLPPWEEPDFDIPPFDFDPSITFGKTFGAFLRGYDTKKDWETLREKCIIYQENMNEFTLTVNHNTLVLKNLVNDIITYIDGDVYPSDLKLMHSSQQLTPLYLEEISPDGFKDIINDFRFKDVSNVYDLNLNFQKILNSLNSLYESDYVREPISYNTLEYMDIQPSAKRMILQLEDMRKKYKEVRRLTLRNMKRIFTYV